MTITNTVTTGYAHASAAAVLFLRRGPSTSAHQPAQAMWTLGIAANWFDTFCAPPESNDQNAGSFNNVSTNPRCGNMRGGASGKNVKPISASAVAIASMLR